jgi:transcriptional regulator
MYQPKKYLKKDKQYIYDFVKKNPFATFVLQGDRLLATHIPVLIKGPLEDFTLYAHIANHNEQFSFLKDGIEALLIFQGPHGYVSSSWYKEKEISTWDYSAVHVNVKLKLQTEEELEDSLQDLVFKFEKQQENPLYFKDLPRDIVEENISRITGFWCEPLKVEAIAKLHQGFDRDDLESVTKHLETRDDPMACPLSRDIKKENNLD